MHTPSTDTSKKCRSVGEPLFPRGARTRGESSWGPSGTLGGGSSRAYGPGGPRPDLRVVLGPPGCGKTEKLLRWLEAELAGGVRPERIAVLTFTRAARAAVFNRVLARFPSIDGEQLHWFRTIHSACYELLGLRPGQVLDDEAYRAFADRHGYELSPMGAAWSDLDDAPSEAPHRTPDDRLRYLHQWRRNARLTTSEALAACPVDQVVPLDFRRFEERLEAFKEARGLCEFADMLEGVLVNGLVPPVRVLFVDEAQDLSPLQIAVVERWFTAAQRVYVAGDDDQVIYRFQAADPRWLLSLAEQAQPEVLAQSYRVPETVHVLAGRIIHRNRMRTPKAYSPRAAEGEVSWASLSSAVSRVAALPEPKKCFVLVRNRAHIPRVARELMDQDVVFRVSGPGGPDPLKSAALLRAIRAAQWLEGSGGSRMSTGALADLLARIPSGDAGVPKDARDRLLTVRQNSLVTREWVVEELGLGILVAAIREQGVFGVMTKVAPDTRRYLERLLRRHGALPDPQVVLTTIHSSKGDEAHLVVLLSDMTRATHDAYQRGDQETHESENRVFYVGVTRAIETLVLVEPQSRRHYEFPSLKSRDLAGPGGADHA